MSPLLVVSGCLQRIVGFNIADSLYDMPKQGEGEDVNGDHSEYSGGQRLLSFSPLWSRHIFTLSLSLVLWSRAVGLGRVLAEARYETQ